MDLKVLVAIFCFLCLLCAGCVFVMAKHLKTMQMQINSMQHDYDQLSEFSLKHIREHG